MGNRSSRKERGRGEPFPVVGIGASAGGVQAFQDFFDNMPSDSGMAFIVVSHLDPTARSHMTELIQRRTEMKVVAAVDGQTIEPDTVFVIPPDRYLTVLDGKIDLARPKEARGHRRPIDMFFHSLGRAMRERAVAIVLSGTGTDGTSGLRTVKSEGGFILAQDPQTAAYPDMPQAATQTGLVDEVLAPKDLPRALMRFSGNSYMKNPESDCIASQEQKISQLLSLLLARTRHDFRSYKKNTIQRRIHRRMSLKGFTELDEYVDSVRDDEDEAKALALDFMITVTGFFRDPAAWKELEEQVIGPLVKDRQPDMPIRVWVPGCATGEEAYSIGMLLLDQMEAAGKQLDVKIFSTDTTTEALTFARNGLYPISVAADVPEERRERYFRTEDDTCRVTEKLRDLVIFAPQNVLQDPPFSRCDLVSCRNLLIYIEPETQKKLLRLFHFALRDGGHLFLGTAEGITEQEGLFKTVSKKWRIYRRSGTPKGGYAEFPLVGSAHNRPDAVHYSDFQPRRRLADVARDALLTQFAPASVVIDSTFRVFYFHGDTGAFLRQPQGEPTDDLLTMIREGLRAKVRAAVHGAIKNGEPSVATVQMRQGNSNRHVRIAARPLDGAQRDDGLLTVTFEESKPSSPHATKATDRPDATEMAASDDLEKENRILREELRGTTEQMESANEELKASNEEILSMNEELQSSNEELETSKEELQSFNEELNTVNAQLQSKLEALEEATNDLNNLLVSTEIATLFLDRQQRIRLFTPAMQELMELIPSDIGRPVGNLAHRFEDGDVAADAEEVLRSLATATREIPAANGNWYLRRTLPYRTQDDRIDGTVITFSNITEAKQLEMQLRAERDYSESVVQTIRQPLLVLGPDLTVEMANDAFYRVFQQDRKATLGEKIYGLGNGQWTAPRLRTLLEDILPNNDSFDEYEVEHDFPRIGRRIMVLNGRRLDDVQLILLAIEDVTERKRNEGQRNTLMQELNHRVKNSLMTVQAIASQTARSSGSLDEFRESFEARIEALARGHDLLMKANWQPTWLSELVDNVLMPYKSRGAKRYRIGGAKIRIVPQAALAFDLILHELATNSAKHGALSKGDGRVEVNCLKDGADGPHALVWREIDGPALDGPPDRKGFGLRLIERSAVHDLDGRAELDFTGKGLICTITFSRNHISAD